MMRIQLLLMMSVFLSACASQEAPRPMQEVTCKYWLQQCHYKARQRCRNQYRVERSIRTDKLGGPQGAYKEFRMLFTCD